MLAEEQREQFKRDISQMKLKSGGAKLEPVLRVLGGLLAIGGVVAAFITYSASLTQNDPRDIASQQILAVGFIGLTVIGVGLFAIAALGRLLRLWLLRQLYEGQAHVDQLTAAIRPNETNSRADESSPVTDTVR